MSFMKFLHMLSLEADEYGNKLYRVANVLWKGKELPLRDELTLKDQVTEITVKVNSDGQYEWAYSKEIGPLQWSFQKGKADRLEDACIEALAFTPEVQILEHAGNTYTWYRSTWSSDVPVWVTYIGDDKAFVIGSSPYEEGYEWQRMWGPSTSAFQISEFKGTCLSLEEAFISAITAPDAFTLLAARQATTSQNGVEE